VIAARVYTCARGSVAAFLLFLRDRSASRDAKKEKRRAYLDISSWPTLISPRGISPLDAAAAAAAAAATAAAAAEATAAALGIFSMRLDRDYWAACR